MNLNGLLMKLLKIVDWHFKNKNINLQTKKKNG